MIWIYDIETYPNCFLFGAICADALVLRVQYEISNRVNESRELMAFLEHLMESHSEMVGFNNIGFDYPVIHQFMKMRNSDAMMLYAKAQAIFRSQDEDDKWGHMVKNSDRVIPQIDLFKIHHFDNKARATSLKALEFAMRSNRIEDLPFPVGTNLTPDQIQVLRFYNMHDVEETLKFYNKSLDMINFRRELTRKYQRDFMNHNDTKIGKDYFVMKLEENGVQCYEYGVDGRKPRQTKREFIDLNHAIFPWIKFNEPEFNRVADWLRQQKITETKGVFKDLQATINGFTFVFGVGGIHGSLENEVIHSDDEHVIIDIDVESYYPSTAIAWQLKPAHLPSTFCEIYAFLKEERKKHKKGTAENAMLKLALNGVYGDSNNVFSVFYDPLMTMSITLNGQLMLCLLAEQVMQVGQLIQVNTDGLTVRVSRVNLPLLRQIVAWWESVTRMKMEEATYKSMYIRDVNNYIAVYENGKRKLKGAYAHELEWHKDHSSLIVPKVTEMHLVDGAPIRETILKWKEPMDFMICGKVNRGSRFILENGGVAELQRTIRYYVTTNGGYLYKIMPPLKGKTEERKQAVESGWQVCICSDISHATQPINYEYYVQEVEKLCLILK